jgi:hypothetical protein
MLTYFQEGGYAMWMILAVAVASLATAGTARGQRRCRALWLGSYGALIAGVFGMAVGMVAVSRNIARYADKGAAVAEGLGELSNNGTFAAVLATGLAVLAVALAPRDGKQAA